ncbi:MAG: archease [Phycisphaerae bacterium]|jgi:SHS2 domain-containing protein|nr:archease [Phycisphaerae bacterium]
MSGHCETFDHTADVGLSGRADSPGELLEALAECMCDLVCPRKNVSPETKRTFSVEAPDFEALTVDFLEAVLGAIQTDRFAVASVKVTDITQTSATAELFGTDLNPQLHEILTEIKAVTYHELEVIERDGSWSARVILDL